MQHTISNGAPAPRASTSTAVAATAQTADLINRLTPIVSGVARKLAGNDHHAKEDYFQEGALAIHQAVSTHDPMQGSLDHYAVVCARRRMMNKSRWFQLRKREIAVGNFAESDEDAPSAALEVDRQLCASGMTDDVRRKVDYSLIWDVATAELTSRELKVVRLIYADGLLPSEAAAQLGISGPRVTQLVRAALTKLREVLVPVSLN